MANDAVIGDLTSNAREMMIREGLVVTGVTAMPLETPGHWEVTGTVTQQQIPGRRLIEQKIASALGRRRDDVESVEVTIESR